VNRSLYIAATGMNAQQQQMDVISNNLANVSTNGFKGSRAVFEDLLYQTVRQPGANSTQQTELPSGSQLGTVIAATQFGDSWTTATAWGAAIRSSRWSRS